jgi:alanyl-tRNA synthetase
MALFGEKYGDEVRVLTMGTSPLPAGGEGSREAAGEGLKPYSVELCGGTHVTALGDIQLFKIVSESAVSSGVRRIEALTGEAARRYLLDREAALRTAANTLKAAPDEVPARVAALVEERRRLERELAETKKKLALSTPRAEGEHSQADDVAGISFIGQVLEGIDPKQLRGLIDEAKSRVASGVVALIALNDGRASIAAGVTPDLTSRFSAVDLVRTAVATLGGQGGGGRPDMAQGGGPDGSKASEALDAVRAALSSAAVPA